MNDLEQRIAALEQQLSGGVQRISGKTDVMPGSLQPRLLVPGVQQNGDLYYSNGTNFVRLGLGAKGSLLYANTVPSWLAPGAANQVLTTLNSVPTWQAPDSKLALATITSSFVTASAAYVDAGLSVTFPIVSTTRYVKLTFNAPYTTNNTAGVTNNNFEIIDTTGGGSTVVGFNAVTIENSSHVTTPLMLAVLAPVVSTRTYKVQMSVNSGTGTLFAATTSPAFLLAELI